ncbi:hypothetical protein A33M_1457 [Rhodovulum sp. PH10]|uniref:heme utilization cystosolic carrier protein HutX n=1 Tax=Rhodovulum sp. PH10 TaxID=1187851 RepID=UPI00027C1DC4|nr:heme utilization cystosolic carrier protein HutX [Rhodovulum sp. PH10]EJW12895.1 hypothetical protein A33M_1457 [Rhodovulum sp. PH10]
MTDAATASEPRAALAARLAKNPDGVLEALAREHGVSTLAATRLLPPDNAAFAPGSAFAEVMRDLSSWGEVLFIVHTQNIVLECSGRIPPGEVAHGWFNLHGDGPIGGHVKAERCVAIGFVQRPFMGRESCSVQFFDGDGEAMFKVFVRRRPDKTLDPDQVAAFAALRARLGTQPAGE